MPIRSRRTTRSLLAEMATARDLAGRHIDPPGRRANKALLRQVRRSLERDERFTGFVYRGDGQAIWSTDRALIIPGRPSRRVAAVDVDAAEVGDGSIVISTRAGDAVIVDVSCRASATAVRGPAPISSANAVRLTIDVLYRHLTTWSAEGR